MYYNLTSTPVTRGETIAAAYQRAGLDAPDRTSAILDNIGERVGMEALAPVLGREAAEGVPDAAAWVDGALERVRDAQAVDALCAHAGEALGAAQRDRLPVTVDEAVDAVKGAFKKSAHALTKNAPDLPATDPFDLEQVVELDATRQMKAAQAALEDLGVYGSIHATPHANGYIRAGLARLLPVVAIPECHPEQIAPERFGQVPVFGQQLGGSHAVRALGRYAEDHGTDAALLAVARGQWEQAGLTLALATAGQLEQRRERVVTAHTQERAKPQRVAHMI